MRGLVAIALLGSLTARADTPQCANVSADEATPNTRDTLTLTKVKFDELPGWTDDKLSEAVPSFLRSCAQIALLKDGDPVGNDGHGGKASQWRRACSAAAKVKPGDDAGARAMFEAEFNAYSSAGKAGLEGKLTGYNVQQIHASRKKGGKYRIPIFDRPKDLVMIDLSKMIPDAHGRRIWGKLDDKGEVQPYATREEIRKGALKGQGLELMYADDPVDVLFAHIEGSAKAVMDDGSVVWLEFAGKNGRAYQGVGAALKAAGALQTPGSGTMQGIRKWFDENPTRFDEIVDKNASYVFFKESKAAGAIGSQMVVLTPMRSLAVDRAFIAHGTPVWVDTRAPNVGATGTSAWRQMLIAQDTGGGILGPVRGDVYWGDDLAAAERGGRMGGPGKMWLLLPKGVTR